MIVKPVRPSAPAERTCLSLLQGESDTAAPAPRVTGGTADEGIAALVGGVPVEAASVDTTKGRSPSALTSAAAGSLILINRHPSSYNLKAALAFCTPFRSRKNASPTSGAAFQE